MPNPSQASVVKRADECPTGAGWPSDKQTVSRHSKHLRLTSFRVLVTAWSCPTHRLRVNVFVEHCSTENSSTRKCYARETLLCPHPGLLTASGLCPQTLLVSSRLGGGAATGPLRTPHQEEEQERSANHAMRLGVWCSDGPAQSVLYIRKTHQEKATH